MSNAILSMNRQQLFRQLLEKQRQLIGLEAHDGLSACIVHNTEVEGRGFDFIWASGLTITGSQGIPDADLGWVDNRLARIQEILDATPLPVVVDGDNGGASAAFESLVRKLERMGVSAVIIEDKADKKNSLLGGDTQHNLEEVGIFAAKISRAKATLGDPTSFYIIARLESLIAGLGVEDALKRAIEYQKAGATGLMIHSRSNEPDEVIQFLQQYTALTETLELARLPIVVVPTTYNTITAEELFGQGANVVIFANHLARSAAKAMTQTAQTLLTRGKGSAVEPNCIPVSQFFELTGLTEVLQRDKEYSPQ